ncbi:hypothetical protein [Pseudonocardia sp.]|uniref:hypothetical protein n=1 Tax=Pseudonocardia sp. TaxID=60912 RepID=UPI002629F266|nr:hypothetical protein [Pseudonocardia sp.]
MSVPVMVSGRDRAVLRAVSAGRCEFRGGCQPVLLVDGLACADFSAAHRLVDAGLIAAPDPAVPLAPVAITPAGRAALAG